MPPRSYKPRPARHRQLLDAAAALVAREGEGALNLRALAREAGVSRQTVYDHFEDAGAVARALADRELAALPALDDLLDGEGKATLGERLRDAVRALLHLDTPRRRLLQRVLVGAGPDGEAGRQDMQRQLEARWGPTLSAMTGLPEPESRAAALGLITCTLALADAMEDGAVAPMSAEALALSMVHGAIQQLWDDVA